MGAKKHVVDLDSVERSELESVVSSGRERARVIRRAWILLRADEGATDAAIAEWFDCSPMTVYRVRKRYATEGISAIHRKGPDCDYDRKLDVETAAALINLARSQPPEGRSRWSLRLLAAELPDVEGVEIESVSHETVRQTLDRANVGLSRSDG